MRRNARLRCPRARPRGQVRCASSGARVLSLLAHPAQRAALTVLWREGSNPMGQPALSEDEIEHFIEHGYVILRGCFDRAFAEKWKARTWADLELSPTEPGGWDAEADVVHCEPQNSIAVGELAPRAWGAIQQLCGGQERVHEPYWCDKFIINFGMNKDQPWQSPDEMAAAGTGGWHADGWHFKHFLDSPEQALLSVVLWSDVPTQHGGTYIAPESVGHIARYLAQHPEGCGGWNEPSTPMPNSREIIAHCSEFVEITGETGDVVLHHPFMLHTSSPNPSGVPRFITNPVSVLKEPMNFNRPDGSYSPVESAILRHLGCTSFEFAPLTKRAGRPAPPITKAGPEEERRVLTQLEALRLDWASAGMRHRQPRSHQLGPPRVWSSTDEGDQVGAKL